MADPESSTLLRSDCIESVRQVERDAQGDRAKPSSKAAEVIENHAPEVCSMNRTRVSRTSVTVARQLFNREAVRISLVLVLALGLRLWNLQGQSLSMDERAEVLIAQGSVREIIHTPDGFPPLYSLILHGWLQLFPAYESARWLSVLFGLLSVAVVWKLGESVGGGRLGLWTAVLIAVSPLHIMYSQEGRSYALYFLVAACALWALFRAFERDRFRDWLLFVLACVTGLFTHYHFSILVLVSGLLFILRRPEGERLKRGLVAFGAVAAFGMPWLLVLQGDLAGQQAVPIVRSFGIAAFAYTYLSFLTGFTLGPSTRELHTLAPAEAIRQALPWALTIGGALVPLAVSGWMELRRTPWLVAIAILLFLPVVAVGLLGELAAVGYHVRYVIWATIPLMLWLAAGLARSARRWPVSIAGLILLFAFCTALYNRQFVDRYQNEDTRSLANYLQRVSNDQVPVFVMSHFMAYSTHYYLGDAWQVVPVPDVRGGPDDLATALATIDEIVPKQDSLWFVYVRPFHGDPHGRLRETLFQTRRLELRARFAGIFLYEAVGSARELTDSELNVALRE